MVYRGGGPRTHCRRWARPQMTSPSEDYQSSGRGQRHLIIAGVVAAGVVVAIAGVAMSGPANHSMPRSDAVERAAATVEDADSPFGGLLLSTTHATPIDGERPKLNLSCGGELGPSIVFDVAQEPERPPPLRGVYAVLTIDGHVAERFELGSSYPDALWMPRTEHPNQEGGMSDAEELRLIRALASARRIRFNGLADFGPTPITWSIELPETERVRFLQQCR